MSTPTILREEDVLLPALLLLSSSHTLGPAVYYIRGKEDARGQTIVVSRQINSPVALARLVRSRFFLYFFLLFLSSCVPGTRGRKKSATFADNARAREKLYGGRERCEGIELGILRDLGGRERCANAGRRVRNAKCAKELYARWEI